MDWPSWTVAGASLAELEALVAGWLFPLAGYTLGDSSAPAGDRVSWVDRELALALDVSAAFAGDAAPGAHVALRDPEGLLVAALRVERRWQSGDTWHLGGPVEGIELPAREEFKQLHLSPGAIAERIRGLGWSRALAFFPGEVLHAGTRAALVDAAGRLEAALIVLIGAGSAGPEDASELAGIRALQLSASLLPSDRTVTAVAPIPIWTDARRSLVRSAVMARNCGACAVAVDVTGDRPAAVEGLASELDVTIHAIRPWGYSPADGRLADPDAAQPGSVEPAPSAREILSVLPAVPDWLLSSPEVEALQRAHPPRNAQGFAVLLTGLSGSGKSTIARALRVRLLEATGRQVTLLDGDLVRRHLSSELGFSREHRDLNILRIGWVASEIVRHGGIVICAPIAPYDSIRRQVRRMIEPLGGFVLVHVSTPLETCEARDRKGLYAKARAGLLPNFTGVSDPYEPPDDAALTIDTRRMPVDEACALILARLTSEGYVPGSGVGRIEQGS